MYYGYKSRNPEVRELNDKQEASLERFADRDPEAIVVGWDNKLGGPIIRTMDLQYKVISPTGYPRNY